MSENKLKDTFMFTENGDVFLARFLPGNETIPGKVDVFDVKSLSELRDAILLGEPGSGLRKVFQWFVNGIDTPFVKITYNLMEFGVANCSSQMRYNRAKRYIKKLMDCNDAHACLVVLRDWISKAEMCHLVMFKPEPNLSKHFAQAFRTLRDEGRMNFNLTIFTTSDDMFVDQAVQSGYFGLCTVFRMPRISHGDLARWATSLDFKFQGDCFSRILTVTGGQPVLVESLLSAIKSVESNPLNWDLTTIDLAGDLMKYDLPLQVELWVIDLRSKLKQDPGLRDRLEKYLSCSLQSHRGVSVVDRGLYISGWLGFNQEGDWGIVSDVHRYLIRKVLLEK